MLAKWAVDLHRDRNYGAPMRRILVLFAHPAIARSRANRQMIAAIRDLEGVHVHDLYERYPRFDIDVAAEKELLSTHDVIVQQHPFYWYSTPPILKQWFDLVLEHGWAYGRNGTALRGKWLLSALTTGGGEPAYSGGVPNRYTLKELLAPIHETARLCGMIYLAPFVIYGIHRLTDSELSAQINLYRRTLTALGDSALDVDRISGLTRLNQNGAAWIDGTSAGAQP